MFHYSPKEPFSVTASTTSGNNASWIGNKGTDRIVGADWRFEPPCALGICAFSLPSNGEYTFSLRNQLNEDVKNVYCLVVFLGEDNQPVDVDMVNYSGVIPAGLAKRLKGRVDASVTQIAKYAQFRVLDYEPVQ